MPGQQNESSQGENSLSKPIRPSPPSTKAACQSSFRSEGSHIKYGNALSTQDPRTADTCHAKSFRNIDTVESEFGVDDRNEDEDEDEDDSDSESDNGENEPSWIPAQTKGKFHSTMKQSSSGNPAQGHENTSATAYTTKAVSLARTSQTDATVVKDGNVADTRKRKITHHTRPMSLHLPGSFAPNLTKPVSRRSMDVGARRNSSYETQKPPHSDTTRAYSFNHIDEGQASRPQKLEHDSLPYNPFQPPESHSPEVPMAHHNFSAYPPNDTPSGMPPGNPHFSPFMANANPFVPYSPLPSHLHPAHPDQRPPPTGHELLASRLTGGVGGLKPMYRRFETLNHRLLLHLQDEICELEEQLSMLDAADTQERLFPGGIYPASRRSDSVNSASNDIQWRKTNILGDIGYKLATYNRILSSFKETMHFPSPLVGEVNDYIAYLDSQQPIVELETRFLDSPEDLITFPPYPTPNSRVHASHPRSQDDQGSNVSMRNTPSSKKSQMARKAALSDNALRDVILGILLAIFVPIVSFGTIPGFLGRMTVVLLVSVGVTLTLIRSGALRTLSQSRGGLDGLVCLGAYGVVMAIIARALG